MCRFSICIAITVSMVIGAQFPSPTPSAWGQAAKNTPAEPKISLKEILGVWRPVSKGDWPLVIVQEDPDFEAYPTRLEAHTQSRVWKGNYYSFPPGHPARGGLEGRAVFKYKPAASEMNPEIPLWARRAIEGDLEWRLELHESESSDFPHLIMKWFKGKVAWREGASNSAKLAGSPDSWGKVWREGASNSEGSVRIEGDGEPTIIPLAQEARLEIEQLAEPVMWIEFVGPKPSPVPAAVTALFKHQPFRVFVRLPPGIAKEAGDELQITIKGLTGKSETTLVLNPYRVAGPGPVRVVDYANKRAATIADWATEPDLQPKLGSTDWIASLYAREDEEGRRLDLSISNKEKVEFRYGDAYQQVTVYEDWIERGLDIHWQSAMTLLAASRKVFADPGAPISKKEAEHQRQRLLANYLTLRTRNDLLNLHKFYLGELYVGNGVRAANLLCKGAECSHLPIDESLVMVSQSHMSQIARITYVPRRDPTYFTSAVRLFVLALLGRSTDPAAIRIVKDITWTSEAEKILVANTVAAASAEVSETFQHNVAETAFSIPKKLAEDVNIVLFSKNLRGKRVVGWQRDVTAARLIASILWDAVQPTIGAAKSGLRANTGRRAGTPSTARSSIRARHIKGAVVQSHRRLESGDGLPQSVAQNQRRQSALQLEAEPGTEGGPRCARPRVRSQSLESSGEIIIDADDLHRETVARDLYGPSVELAGPRLRESQTAGTCVAAVDDYLIHKRTGEDLGDVGVIIAGAHSIDEVYVSAAKKAKFLDPVIHLEYVKFAGKTPSEIIAKMFKDGFPTRLSRHVLRSRGADVAVVPPSANGRTNLRHVKALLDRGYDVKMILDLRRTLGRTGEFHMVAVTALEADASGQIVKVRFFEPNVGGEIRLPLAEFESLIARKTVSGKDSLSFGNLTAVKWDDRAWTD